MLGTHRHDVASIHAACPTVIHPRPIALQSMPAASSIIPALLPIVAVSICLVTATPAQNDDAERLAVIANTGPQGIGSLAAKEVRDELAKRSVEFLPSLLAAMDTSNPVAANWYRTIYEEIVSREIHASGTQWPLDFMKEYVSDTNRQGRPRRLVLKLINQLEPEFESQWLTERLADPEFRSEAVALTLSLGDQALQNKDTKAATIFFRSAFANARDRSQVTQAAQRLTSVGEKADVNTQLGLVTDWWLTGPFDAPAKSGFETAFEPERSINLQATYEGQGGLSFGWIRHQTTDALGQMNLVNALGQTDEAVGYAWTEITVEQNREAELRCGADDCCLVWLNGKPVSTHEQWLNGTRFDRFINPIELQAGRNTILVKVCQGPQHRNPEVFNYWSLQLRLCDKDGRGISFQTALPEVVDD